ncbi:centromere protein I isoform X2 [Manduca sexta]|nr:centromere protein I isoform X2 [Manduca sexta]
MIEERTIDYVFQWILANYGNENNFSKINFVLDWITAAMEYGCIDMTTLDLGYELFYSMLTYEALTPHVMKLVYTLTKPSDVTRKRVTELLEYAKMREGKKNMYRQLQVLLGLFKSYKPECVPEDVPALSIHTAFKNINANLVNKFKQCQERRNNTCREKEHLMWMNPINAKCGGNKKADPLIPNVEFFNIGAKQYANKEPPKNYLDFSEPVSLLQYSLAQSTSRPARLRALLGSSAGFTLLAVAAPHEHAFLSHDLHHLLNMSFLDVSPHSYVEKKYLLHRLALLQRTLMQGIPVITRFLAQYLPLWNEKDYFSEILELVEWISIDCPDQIGYIVGPLTKTYHRAQPIEQCAILRSLTNMYTNLVFGSTRQRQHFMGAGSPNGNYALVLPKLAAEISDMCGKELQTNPEDMRAVWSAARCARRQAAAWRARGAAPDALPPRLALYLPLLAPSAALLDYMAALMILYKKIFTRMKSLLTQRDETYCRHIETLQSYTEDMLSWLYRSQVVSTMEIDEERTKNLRQYVPNVDDMLSIKNHLAFAPYTYAHVSYVDDRDVNDKVWYDTVVQQFPDLDRFLKMAIPELR